MRACDIYVVRFTYQEPVQLKCSCRLIVPRPPRAGELVVDNPLVVLRDEGAIWVQHTKALAMRIHVGVDLRVDEQRAAMGEAKGNCLANSRGKVLEGEICGGVWDPQPFADVHKLLCQCLSFLGYLLVDEVVVTPFCHRVLATLLGATVRIVCV